MNLAKTSLVVKNLVKALGIFVVLYYLSVYVFIPVGKSVANSIIPDKDPPNPKYGLLDPVEFTSLPLSNSNPTYNLNTKTGKLPSNMPKKVPIFRFKSPVFSYEAGRAAQTDAQMLGFTEADRISDLKGDVYRWVDKDTGSFLEISIHEKDLVANTPLAGKERFYPAGEITPEDAPGIAVNILKNLGRFNDEQYIKGKTVTYMGRVSPTGVYETKLREEAQIIRVDFFRGVGVNTALNKLYPILGPDAKKGLLHLYVKKPSNASGLPALNHPIIQAHYKEIETRTDASYPIIPVEEAWLQVSSGKGIISNVTPSNANRFADYKPVRVDKILINDIYLAFYEPLRFTKYAQPIYVFEGNYTAINGIGGTITIYYPALSPEYVKQPEPAPQTPESELPGITPENPGQ